MTLSILFAYSKVVHLIEGWLITALIIFKIKNLHELNKFWYRRQKGR